MEPLWEPERLELLERIRDKLLDRADEGDVAAARIVGVIDQMILEAAERPWS
jgi:hypothetical protein